MSFSASQQLSHPEVSMREDLITFIIFKLFLEYFPQTCSDLVPNHGVDASGVYVIYPFGNSTSLPVYCDLTTADGGWLVSSVLHEMQ